MHDDGDLCAICRVELLEHMRHVVGSRAVGDHQRFGDLTIREALHDQARDLSLAARQLSQSA
jgi:hypothetical protein